MTIDPPFTYAEVGATAGQLPSGYDHYSEYSVIRSGRDDFDAAPTR